MTTKLFSYYEKYNEWTINDLDYTVICSDIKKITGANCVLFNKYLPEKNNITTIAVAGITEKIDSSRKSLNLNLVSREWEINGHKNAISSECIAHGFFKQESKKLITSKLLNVLYTILNINTVHCFGIPSNKKLFGSFIVLSKKSNELKNIEEIEMFSNFIGAMLKRIYTFDELVKSNEQLKLITEQNKDILITVNNQNKITYINKPFFEKTIEQIIGLSILDLIYPENFIIFSEAIKNSLNGEEQREEFCYANGNSKKIWYCIKFNPITINNINHVYITITNITEQKNNSIDRKGLKYSNNIEKIGNWAFDFRTNKYTISDSLSELLEIDSENYETTNLMTFLDLNYQVEIKRLHQVAKNTGKGYDTTVLAKTKNGKSIWLQSIAEVEKSNGVPVRLKGTIIDVTEQLNLENSEKQTFSELKQFREIINNSSLISYTDLKGNILYANTSFCELSQYTQKELINKNHNLLNSGVHPKEFWKGMWEKLKKGEVWKAEVCNKKKDGTLYWVECYNTSINDANGKPYLYYSIRNDITERKINQIELIKEKENLKKIFEATNAGTWEYNLVTQNITINDKWAEFIGYTKKDFAFLNKELEEKFIHPDDLPILKTKLKDCINSENDSYNVDIRIKHKNGYWVWVNDNVKILNYVNGLPLLMFGVRTDITKEKQANNNLIKMLEDLNNTQKISKIGRWSLNLLTNELIWSEGIFEIFEIDSSVFEASYDAFLNLVHPDDRDYVNDSYTSSLVDKQPYEIIHRLLMPDKRIKWVIERCNTEYSPNGNPLLSVGSIQDITKIKEAEEILKSKSQEQHIINSISQELLSVTLENYDEKMGVILKKISTYFNVDRVTKSELSENIDGVLFHNEYNTNEKLSTRGQYNKLPDDLLNKFREIVNLDYYEVSNEELDKLNKAGLYNGLILKNILLFSLKNKNNETIGFIGLTTINKNKKWGDDEVKLLKVISNMISNADIKYKIELDLLSAKNNALSAIKTKGEFLANMSHEIRTPLNAIIGYTELLKNKISNENLLTYVRGVEIGGHNLLSIINDILDLSKIEAGQMKINIQPVNIQNLLDELYSIFKVTIESKNISFSIKYNTPEILNILTDEIRLRQIFFNLIGNALKFTNNLGSVFVEVNCKLNAESNNYSLILTVSDTGVGISPNQFNTIFEAFKQQEGQNSRKYGGTGLGLTITKRLVNILGGEISVTSEINKGSQFTVEFENIQLPNELEVNKKSRKNRINKTYFFNQQKVLIIEDNELNRKMLTETLTEFNFNVTAVEGGKEAIEYITKGLEIDIILLDLMMPEMDGYEVFKKIRTIAGMQHTPIIAVSASGIITDKKQFDGIVSKPIDRNELLKVMSNLLKAIKIKKIYEKNNSSTFLFKINKEQSEIVKEVFFNAKRTKSIDDIALFATKISELNTDNDTLDEYAENLKYACEAFEIDTMNALIENVTFKFD